MRKLLCYSAVFIGAFLYFSSAHVFAERDKFLDIQEIKTESGITAWLVEDHKIPVIALDFAFADAGAKNDPQDKQGLARLLSNTMDEGAGELDSQSFQKELRDLSINLGFSASRDTFGGSVKTLSANKSRAFELLKLALSQPRFDDDPVQRMRQANQARIRNSMSDPDWMAARIMNDKAYAGHPYARNSGGTLSSLDAITPDDLREFAKTQFSKDRLHIAVAGDISAEELKAAIEDIFGHLPNSVKGKEIETLSLQNKSKTYLYLQEQLPQTVIQIQQPGIARTDPKYHTAQVMNFVLGSSGFGSRLTEVIREQRGLTYGIYSYFSTMNHFNGLSISTSTANKNVPQVLQLITEECSKIRSYPISEKELEDAKAYLIGALPLSLTSTDKISSLLLSIQLDGLPIDYLDQRQAAIEKTTIDDVFAMSQKLLAPENFVTVLVGNPSGIANAETVETLPNVE